MQEDVFMQRIKEQLAFLKLDAKKYKEQFKNEFVALTKSKIVQDFLVQNPSFQDKYEDMLLLFSHVVKETDNCLHCKSLDSCCNTVKGYFPKLVTYDKNLDVVLQQCEKLKVYLQEKKQQSLIKSHHIPKNILTASFSSIDPDEKRINAIEAAIDFCARFAKGIPTKGLYFYGPLGAGKSYIAGAIANELIKYGIESFMFYVPEFIREISDAILDNSISEKLLLLKEVKVLILDDIGSEFLTPWKRDEILGSILQYRCSNQLPTVYTSNLTLDELEEHFTYTTKGSDLMKAKRIMERIRHFVKPLYVGGVNRRSL